MEVDNNDQISTFSRDASEYSTKNDPINEDDPEKANLNFNLNKYKSSNEIQGVVPKLDDHERAQMMGFIAYA
jgi:hypothetical protein